MLSLITINKLSAKLLIFYRTANDFTIFFHTNLQIIIKSPLLLINNKKNIKKQIKIEKIFGLK